MWVLNRRPWRSDPSTDEAPAGPIPPLLIIGPVRSRRGFHPHLRKSAPSAIHPPISRNPFPDPEIYPQMTQMKADWRKVESSSEEATAQRGTPAAQPPRPPSAEICAICGFTPPISRNPFPDPGRTNDVPIATKILHPPLRKSAPSADSPLRICGVVGWEVAEREGFEPSDGLLHHRFSKPAL